MKTAQRLVPELRFPGFEGAWEIKRLENLCSTFKSGNSITSERIFEKGRYPVFGGNGLRGYTDDYTHDGNYFLIGRQGALCGNIKRTNGKSFISEHAIAVCSDEYSVTEWLAQRLDYKKLNRFSESSAQPGLSVNKLLRLKIFAPTLPEQQKIAAFLSGVDKKIENLSRKKELLQIYKKGVMQKIFSCEIRFKDDDGKDFPDWEEKRLGEVAKIYDGTHNTPNYQPSGIPFYSVEHLTRGDFSETKYISEEVYLKENKRVRLEKGDILMTRIGDVGTSVLLDWDVKASFYVSLALIKRSKKFYSDYLNQYIKSDLFQRSLWGKMIHVAFPKKINLGEIGMCSVLLPIKPEQQKIASFLSNIDKKIEAVDKQLNQIKTFKKGLLQKMFV